MNTSALVKVCLCVLALSCTAAIDGSGAMPPSPKQEGLLAEPLPLEVTAETANPARDVVFPPPGTHQVPKGDTVVLQGRRRGAPDCPPAWSGDVTGGPSFAVTVVMDSAKRAAAAFDGGCVPSAGRDAFAAPDKGALHAFLGSGDLYGWFSMNRSRPGYGAGITHMVSGEYPYAPVFMRPDLNFEHIMNGCAADAWRAQDTPRKDPMELRLPSPSRVEIRWPAQTSTWKLDCVMRYAFTGRNAVDMEFEVTPRADEAPRGYLVFMWASYMHTVADRNLNFPGVRNGVEGWTEFGGGASGGGTVGPVGQADVAWEEGADMMNLAVRPDVHFTEPFYYGLVDGDQDWETTGDAMAFIMMFDSREDTRFAVWNWGDDRHSTAWDWQFVLRNPEVGKTYRHRSRLVYKKFQGQEDVLAEYRSWQRAEASQNAPEAVELRPFPAVFAPGENGYSALARADKIAEAEPERAPAAYRRLLRTDIYRETAAERINQYFDRKGDLAGLAAEWESIAAQRGCGALPWSRLGEARLGGGETAKAAEAFAHGLEQDAGDRRCLVGRASVELLEGRIDSGLAMLDRLVAEDADNAHPAGTTCAYAAKAHAGAGRRDVAVQLYRRAVAYWPEDLGFRLQLGELHQSMGSLAEALEEYRAVVAEAPESPKSSARMDAILETRGDQAARVEEWRRLAAAHPEAATPLLHLGLALEVSGDRAGAREALERALKINPALAEAQGALGRLDNAAGDGKP
jgi:tetratricopeptide (TPR) repeat protein